MRERRRGYPMVVSVGHKKDKKEREKITEKQPILMQNITDLETIKKNQIGIVGKVGKKKRLEIAKKAEQMKIILHNLNAKTFLKKNEKPKKKIEEKKPETKEIQNKTKKVENKK